VVHCHYCEADQAQILKEDSVQSLETPRTVIGSGTHEPRATSRRNFTTTSISEDRRAALLHQAERNRKTDRIAVATGAGLAAASLLATAGTGTAIALINILMDDKQDFTASAVGVQPLSHSYLAGLTDLNRNNPAAEWKPYLDNYSSMYSRLQTQ
jgi:hypothetical protein